MLTDQRDKSEFNVTSVSKGGNAPKWQGHKELATSPRLSRLWADQSRCQSKCALRRCCLSGLQPAEM